MRISAKSLAIAAIAATVATPAISQVHQNEVDHRGDRELIALLDSELPDERLDAAKTLGTRGENVLPALLDAIQSEDWRVRRGVTDVLIAMGEAGKPAVPALLVALEDENDWVRDGAAEALGKAQDTSPKVIAALAKACEDKNNWVRFMAVGALKRATDDPEILVPAAIKLLHVRDMFARDRGGAVNILKEYGKGHEGSIPALLRVIDHPSEGMFSPTGSAVDALIACGAEDEIIVDALSRLAKRDLWAHRNTAVSLLAKLGPQAKSAVPLIKDLAENDPHPKTRAAAQRALDQLTGVQPEK
jgi:HEAT repeat protein